jgi:hypothetical protein
LVAKVAYEIEEVSFQDVLTLYDNLLWCQDKATKEIGFAQKFGKSLSSLTEILKATRFHPASFQTTLKGLSKKFRAELEDFSIPKRNFRGVERHVKGLYQIVPHRESGIPTNQLPSKPYIGVGYKDKGHRRDPAWDGSPSWQDVAMRGHHEKD